MVPWFHSCSVLGVLWISSLIINVTPWWLRLVLLESLESVNGELGVVVVPSRRSFHWMSYSDAMQRTAIGIGVSHHSRPFCIFFIFMITLCYINFILVTLHTTTDCHNYFVSAISCVFVLVCLSCNDVYLIWFDDIYQPQLLSEQFNISTIDAVHSVNVWSKSVRHFFVDIETDNYLFYLVYPKIYL